MELHAIELKLSTILRGYASGAEHMVSRRRTGTYHAKSVWVKVKNRS